MEYIESTNKKITSVHAVAETAFKTAWSNTLANTSISTGTWTDVCNVTLTPGYWMVTARVTFASNAYGLRGIRFGFESGGFNIMQMCAPANGNTTVLSGARPWTITANTSFSIQAYQTCGAALTISAVEFYAVRLSTI